jgi:ADP-ribosylglycohydrolase
MWVGISPQRSGVYSAGNGPAMRSAILGVALPDMPTLRAFVRASTRLTHTDPKAEYGALAVAVAARMASRCEQIAIGHYAAELNQAFAGEAAADELLELVELVAASVDRGESTLDFAAEMGCPRRVSGYVYQTVPIVLHAWLRHPDDFRAAVTAVIECGGDADTTAAIVGAIVGSRVGKPGIPADWLNGLWERPRSVAWMENLAQALERSANGDLSVTAPRASARALIPRNLLFLAIVLGHGLRRLLPPY